MPLKSVPEVQQAKVPRKRREDEANWIQQGDEENEKAQKEARVGVLLKC